MPEFVKKKTQFIKMTSKEIEKRLLAHFKVKNYTIDFSAGMMELYSVSLIETLRSDNMTEQNIILINTDELFEILGIDKTWGIDVQFHETIFTRRHVTALHFFKTEIE